MTEILYSKKHPTPLESLKLPNSGRSFLENIKCIPNKEKEALAVDFIKCGKKLASDFEIDIEIIKHNTSVIIELSCYDMGYFDLLKDELIDLLDLCDNFNIWTNPKITKGYHYLLTFSLDTHDTYIDGKKIG